MARTAEIDNRRHLHLQRDRPWRQKDEAVCGTVPGPDHLINGDSMTSWRYVEYVLYRGRCSRYGSYAITEVQGATRRLCDVCMRGGESDED